MYAPLEAHTARALVNDRQRQYDPDRRWQYRSTARRTEQVGPRLRLLHRTPRR